MRKYFRSIIVLLCFTLLAGCQTASHGLSQEQVLVLRALGFEPLGDEWTLSLSASILFGFNDDQLTQESREQIQQLGTSLREVGITRLRIDGHADNQGQSDYNLMLSQRRADNVAHEISASGLYRTDIQAQGLGSLYPVASNDTPEGRAQNRRVSLIVIP